MLIGLLVFVVLCKNAGIEFWGILTNSGNHPLNLEYSLRIVSYGLGISAGIEMAYMLFTPGPDEAVEPVILGLASTLLYVLSLLDPAGSNLIQYSVLIVSISATIGGLFFVKDKYVNKS